MIVDKNQFFEIQTKYFSDIPFNQTKEWFESTVADANIFFFINDIHNPEIAFWARAFDRKYIGKHLIVDGVALKTNDIKKIRLFFLDLVEKNFSFIEISDLNIYSIDLEIGIRQAGFIRPILSLSPLSIIVNTQETFKFHKNWKRNVKKAIEKGCSFEIIDTPTNNHLREFVDLFKELKDRKRLGFSLDEDSLKILLKTGSYKLFLVKDENEKYISGRIIYIQGNKSYDVYAANSNEGIAMGAAYYIQENMLFYLKENNIKQFDYGRISPSNDEMNNIYISKNYSGGQPVSYNGQWFYSKNKKIGLLYELYKFLNKKQRRY